MRKKPVIIVGYRGNMGSRYTAILDSLMHPWYGIEMGGLTYCGQNKVYVSELPACVDFHSMIIATTTMSHKAVIQKYRNLNLPMLVEKPISKEEPDIQFLVDNNLPVAMVNQYKYLVSEKDSGPTYYNYFKSGMDGLKWDCISVIGLAKEKPTICNSSPIWTCCINGRHLSLGDMDGAYMEMIERWLDDPKPDLEYIKLAHRRIHEGFYCEEKDKDCSDRGPSEVDVDETTKQSSSEVRPKDNAGNGARDVQKKRRVSGAKKSAGRSKSSSAST